MRKVVILFLLLISADSFCQKTTSFWIYPDVGYTYQKIHIANAGLRIGVAQKNAGYHAANYTVVFRTDIFKDNNTTYISPVLGLRGYNYLFGTHNGISYGFYGSNFIVQGKTDWIITPEIGFAYLGCLNISYGYSLNLDKRDLPFYSNHRISLRFGL